MCLPAGRTEGRGLPAPPLLCCGGCPAGSGCGGELPCECPPVSLCVLHNKDRARRPTHWGVAAQEGVWGRGPPWARERQDGAPSWRAPSGSPHFTDSLELGPLRGHPVPSGAGSGHPPTPRPRPEWTVPPWFGPQPQRVGICQQKDMTGRQWPRAAAGITLRPHGDIPASPLEPRPGLDSGPARTSPDNPELGVLCWLVRHPGSSHQGPSRATQRPKWRHRPQN